jgi:hypothetical protein
MRTTLIAALLGLALSGGFRLWSSASEPQCNAVSFTARLHAGEDFTQKVDDLEFEIRPTHDEGFCDGWYFSLEDPRGHDFIYPVNMPLRFNPSQYLGCSYGLSARQGLEMKRSLRFILTQGDYLRLDPLMRNALWPGDSPDPEHAAERYLKAIAAVRRGFVRLSTLHFELSSDGLVRSAVFQVDVIAPADFHFNPALKPYSMTCPATETQ